MEKINFEQEFKNLDENLRQRAKDALLYKQVMEVINQMTPKDIIRDARRRYGDDPEIEIYELENGLNVYLDKESNELAITPQRDYNFEMTMQRGTYSDDTRSARTQFMSDLAFHLSSRDCTSEFTYNCSSPKGIVHTRSLPNSDRNYMSISLSNEIGNSRFILEGNVEKEVNGESHKVREICIDQNYFAAGKDSADMLKTIINNLTSATTKSEFESRIDSFTEKLSELYDRIPEQEINQTIQYLEQNYPHEMEGAKKSISEQLINQKVKESSIELLNSISPQIQNVTNQSSNDPCLESFTLESGLNIYTFSIPSWQRECIICSPERIDNIEQIKDYEEFSNLARSNTSLFFDKMKDELVDAEITIVDDKPLDDDKSFDSVTIHTSGNSMHSAKYPNDPHITKCRRPEEEYFISRYSTELSENIDNVGYTFEYPTNLEDILEKTLEKRTSGIERLPEDKQEAFIRNYKSLYLMLSEERGKIKEKTTPKPIDNKEETIPEMIENREETTPKPIDNRERTTSEQVVHEGTIHEQSEMNTDSDTHSQNKYETLSLGELGQRIQQVDQQINLLRQSISSLTSLGNLPGIKENINSLNDSILELETTRVEMQQAENLKAGKTAQKIEEAIKNLVQVEGQEAVCTGLQAQLQMLKAKYPDISREEIRDNDGR